jgi:outer membrane receptor protein involved in Fe transport
MKRTSPSLKLLLGASVLAMATAAPAFAQEDGSADDDQDTRRLSTVSVTATQRVASIQDVPIAVTALDAESLEKAGVADITNLPQLSASFNMSNSQSESGGSTLRIRGVGTTGNNAGLESAVGVFLDGVYLSRPGVALADLVDLEQIEVLRGPQGTLFGRNTSAGALNIKTKAPNLSEVDGFLNATMGNYDANGIQAGVSIPLIEDQLGIRLSGAFRNRGPLASSTTGAESHTRQREMLRAQLQWEPNEDVTLRVIADHAKGTDECCDAVHVTPSALLPLFNLAGLGANGGVPAVGQSAIDGYDTNADQYQNPFEQNGISAELNWDVGFANMTYLAAHREYMASSTQDSDFTNLEVFSVGPGLNGLPNGQDITFTSHELRFQGNAMDDRLDWLVGAYYSDEEIEATGSMVLGPDYQAYAGARFLAIPGVAAGFGTNPLLALAGGVDANGSFAINDFNQQGESFSIFTHNTFYVTDQLSATLGVRYVDESKDGSFDQRAASSNACTAVQTGAITGSIPGAFAAGAFGLTCFPFATEVGSPFAALLPAPREFDDTFEDDELVYTAALGYEFTEDISGYASLTHGFKSGGFNLDPTAAVSTNFAAVQAGLAPGGTPVAPVFADPTFDSEKIDSYEVGLKSDFWGGRARVNVAAFYSEMEDFQVLEFTGTRFQTFNVDKATSTGVEVESQFLLTDELTISPAITWTDAKYPDDCANQDATAADFNLNAATLCGNSLTNAPEIVAILGADYSTQVDPNGMTGFINGSVRYEDERRTSPQAVQPATGLLSVEDIQDANTKVDLRAGLTSPSGKWTFELWGKNITDERTKSVTFNIPLNVGARGAFFQDPATYGVTLRVKH